MKYDKNKSTLQIRRDFEKLQRKYASEGEIAPEILAALRAGDENAYREVYLQFAEPLVNFLKLLTRSHEQAEDMAQEILINLWITREKIDPRKSIKGLLFTIARQKAIDHRRKNRARGIFDSYDWLPESVDPEGVDDHISAKEIELILRMRVEQMPDQRRRIFEMSHDEGLPNEEIARRLGITKPSVEKQISYVRRDLRDVMTLLIILFVSSQ